MNAEATEQRRLISSRSEYLEAADALYELAQRELCIFDPDLEMLALNALSRAGTLRTFLTGGPDNRVRIALHDPAHAQQACPRLIELLRDFSPRVQIYRTEGVAANAQDRFILADQLHFVRRPVAEQSRGVFGLHQTQDARLLQERFEEIWVLSVEAVAANTLGL
ncbi:MAG TPA: hypothetical protein VJM53_02285 [Burkholderiales bacterium]|nr:hypothetical protein [Burkholderiales bacterium]